MDIYPAIDLIDGQCVRLTQGDYSQETVYNSNPQAQASQFAADGARWLHVVDLEAAKTGQPQNLASIEAICSVAGLAVQVGGGVRSLATAQQLRDVGAARVVMGTAAIENPDLVAQVAAAMPVLLSVDTRKGMVATHGWQQASSRHFSELLSEFSQAGLAAVMLTDIAQDGMLTGPNLELYEAALGATAQHEPPLAVIASGGVGQLGAYQRAGGIADARWQRQFQQQCQQQFQQQFQGQLQQHRGERSDCGQGSL